MLAFSGSMRVLGIETATRRASVALWENGVAVARAQAEEPKQHAERMLLLADDAFKKAGWAKGSIDLVACGVGPGSFTGVRVGMATAKGIAMGLGRPIVAVGSLEAMARAFRSDAEAIICVLDAKKGEVFLAAYSSDGAVLLGPTHLASSLATREIGRFADKKAVVLGEIAASIDTAGVPVHRAPATDLPDAETIARVGAERMLDRGPSGLHELEPMYLRPPDITSPRNAGHGGTLGPA
jgi:tRNA threonylcarbamoyladenosine biosynthesis protein TsaB